MLAMYTAHLGSQHFLLQLASYDYSYVISHSQPAIVSNSSTCICDSHTARAVLAAASKLISEL